MVRFYKIVAEGGMRLNAGNASLDRIENIAGTYMTTASALSARSA